MKLVFLDSSTVGEDIDLGFFSKFGDFVSYPTSDYEQALKRAKEADIIITNKVLMDENLMSNCPRLKLVCLTATGMNNVDLSYAKKKNIQVKNVAGYSTKSVAQYTFMQVLNFLGQSKNYDEYVKSKEWVKSKIFTNLDFITHDIEGKKWGIIGLGEIGKEVAKIAEAFGCHVSYYSTSGKNTKQKYPHEELHELLKTSDIISIHCPLNELTNNLLDEKELVLLKQDAILVNVARGGIVNEKALSKAINNKKIYTCVDVLTSEPMSEDSPYLNITQKDRILFSPHIAWASVEARVRLMKGIEKNIEEFLKG